MSAGFIGADIQQLESLAGTFDSQAGQLESIKSTVQNRVYSTVDTHWRGADATQFRSQWDSAHAVNLQRVIDALREAAGQVRRNAAEQSAASGG